MSKSEKFKTQAWVVAVSMGYGHQRTAYPLRELAPQAKIIYANDYEGIPESDKNIWQSSRRFYEFMSNFRKIPLIGPFSFYIFDRFQKILSFYPKRDLSESTFVLQRIFELIKNGWGKHLIETLSQNPLPLLTTFFTPAFMAEVYEYPGEIYCIICDADISRAWVSLNPGTSRIKYLAPTERVTERLKLYGVKKENIFLTGYPLPKENLGTPAFETLRKDVGKRLMNLDPQGKYCKTHFALVRTYLSDSLKRPSRPLTILFSVGGAGAQKEIALKAIKSLAQKIKTSEIKFIVSAGTKSAVRDYFEKMLRALNIKINSTEGVQILYEPNVQDYFKKFNETLRETDILWTKPSELSFYSALGIPIIIAPPLGSQETFNRDWLLSKGSGIAQNDPVYTNEWLFDYLNEGRFAETAMEGLLETEKLGTFNIEKIITKGE